MVHVILIETICYLCIIMSRIILGPVSLTSWLVTRLKEILRSLKPEKMIHRAMNNLQLSDQWINKSDIFFLVRAAKNGDLEAVNDLLNRGVDPNAPVNDGYTALAAAVFKGHIDVVKALLVHGARPDESRVLLDATFSGFLEIVKLLLAHQADPNTVDLYGITALHCAAQFGFLDITHVLLDKGANPNKADHNGFTALNQAAHHGHTEIVKALLARGAEHAKSRDLLWHAVISTSLAVVKELLSHGVQPNECPTALVAAVQAGHQEIVLELLACGADPNIPCMFGHLALDRAFSNGHCEMVNILLDNSARPSPLVLVEAAGLGYSDTVQKLLDLGVDPNTPALGTNPTILDTRCHTTPLCQAAQYGHLAVVDVLIKGGADPDLPDEIDTPLYYAANYGHDEIVDKLLAVGARADKSPVALTQAVYGKNMAMVETLLAHGADPDAHHVEDSSALCRAVCSGRIELVDILLANGAKPEKTPDALVEAVSCGKLEMVKMLLANGARPDTPDKNNCTALVQARAKGHTKIINLLESHTSCPDSLLNIARTCIRTRLIKRQRDGVQSLRSSVAELPLPRLHKEYVYGPLSAAPEELVEIVPTPPLRVDMSL